MVQPTAERGRVRLEPGRKRVRAYLGGQLVVDTTRPFLVWENPHYPAYYLPVEDVRVELVRTGRVARSPAAATRCFYDERVELFVDGQRVPPNPDSPFAAAAAAAD